MLMMTFYLGPMHLWNLRINNLYCGNSLTTVLMITFCLGEFLELALLVFVFVLCIANLCKLVVVPTIQC